MQLARRSFLTGLGAALISAPAIVRAGSLMAVKAVPDVWVRRSGVLWQPMPDYPLNAIVEHNGVLYKVVDMQTVEQLTAA